MTTFDGTEVGKITKQWIGIVKESFTDADNFEVTLPSDLDAKVKATSKKKATLLGAVVLVDFMHCSDPFNPFTFYIRTLPKWGRCDLILTFGYF